MKSRNELSDCHVSVKQENTQVRKGGRGRSASQYTHSIIVSFFLMVRRLTLDFKLHPEK